MKSLSMDKTEDQEYMIPGGKDWKPSIILLDSTGAVSMASTARSTSRTRHIDRHFHYVHQGQVANRHKLSWIVNTDQVADIGTKAVSLAALQPIVNIIFVPVQD
jgi:hypothetical protein